MVCEHKSLVFGLVSPFNPEWLILDAVYLFFFAPVKSIFICLPPCLPLAFCFYKGLIYQFYIPIYRLRSYPIFPLLFNLRNRFAVNLLNRHQTGRVVCLHAHLPNEIIENSFLMKEQHQGPRCTLVGLGG